MGRAAGELFANSNLATTLANRDQITTRAHLQQRSLDEEPIRNVCGYIEGNQMNKRETASKLLAGNSVNSIPANCSRTAREQFYPVCIRA